MRCDAEVWKANVKDQIGLGSIGTGAEAVSCAIVDEIKVRQDHCGDRGRRLVTVGVAW
jgi:hypothetical protein